MSKGVKTPWVRLAYLLPALAVVACGGGDDPQVPTTIAAPNGTSLTGTVGSAFLDYGITWFTSDRSPVAKSELKTMLAG